jgi:hypothetical protein
VFLGILQLGCGRSAFYPGYVSPCVEATQVKKQAQSAQGDEKAMLELKAKALEDACRDNMNDIEQQQNRFPRQGPSPF